MQWWKFFVAIHKGESHRRCPDYSFGFHLKLSWQPFLFVPSNSVTVFSTASFVIVCVNTSLSTRIQFCLSLGATIITSKLGSAPNTNVPATMSFHKCTWNQYSNRLWLSKFNEIIARRATTSHVLSSNKDYWSNNVFSKDTLQKPLLHCV